MSAQDYQVEELLERIRRLESSDAARRQAMPTEVIQAPRREAPNRADIQHSNFRADSVNTAGRDMYVVQLEERVTVPGGPRQGPPDAARLLLAEWAVLHRRDGDGRVHDQPGLQHGVGHGNPDDRSAGVQAVRHLHRDRCRDRGGKHRLPDPGPARPATEGGGMSGADQSAGGSTTISFQNVHAQQINTAGRDMIVSTGAVGGWNVAQEQLSALRGELDAFGLPPAARRTVEQTLHQAEAESRSAHRTRRGSRSTSSRSPACFARPGRWSRPAPRPSRHCTLWPRGSGRWGRRPRAC